MARPRAHPLPVQKSYPNGNAVRLATEKDRQFVSALARGLDVLRAFEVGDEMLGNQEIAARSRLTKPTVSRLTYTLTQLGYLNYDQNLRKYGIGIGVLALVQPILRRIELRHLVRPLMQELADEVNAAVGIGTVDGLSALYLEVCRGAEAVTVRLDPGSKLDITTSAMGRALFVAMPPAARNEILQRCERRDPKNFKRVERALNNAIADVEERGFCFSISDWSSDVNGVGVPLTLRRGEMVFALNCGGAAWTMPPARLENEIGPKLVELGKRIASSNLVLG
ncbi:MAG: IclR family transcriptional regulator [Burkholderiales bacterium]|nr:IclR family transcriptional regulator [Burkholderiales bacterium]